MPGHPKIRQKHAASVINEDVLRFEVSVEKLSCVQILEAPAELAEPAHDDRLRKARTGRLRLMQFAGQVMLAAAHHQAEDVLRLNARHGARGKAF
jgi:hypothetical protein